MINTEKQKAFPMGFPVQNIQRFSKDGMWFSQMKSWFLESKLVLCVEIGPYPSRPLMPVQTWERAHGESCRSLDTPRRDEQDAQRRLADVLSQVGLAFQVRLPGDCLQEEGAKCPGGKGLMFGEGQIYREGTAQAAFNSDSQQLEKVH